MNFGTELRRLREKAKKSQSLLAKQADFDHSYISRLEAGSRLPTREAVERISSALGLTEAHKSSLMASAGYTTAYTAREFKWPILAELGEALEKLEAAKRERYIADLHRLIRVGIAMAEAPADSGNLRPSFENRFATKDKV